MGAQGTIDTMKRRALSEILKNLGTNIKSVHVISKLNNYIRTGSSARLALSTMYNPPAEIPMLADFSAKVLLAYLNLYSQYVVNMSSYPTIDALATVAFSKYNYIFFKYKELYSIFEKKKLEKSYRYTQYIDFAIPTSIYAQAFSNSVFGLTNILQLSYKDVLSLPILSTKIVYPDMINAYVNDPTIAKFTHKSDNRNVFCSIDRPYGDHIGTIKSVDFLTSVPSSSSRPQNFIFTGKLNGFIASTIYFKVVEFIDNWNIDATVSLTYTTSLDGVEWSTPRTTSSTNPEKLYVLDDIDTGLTFQIDGWPIEADDVWALNLNYIRLQDPSLNIKMIFNMIYSISYISFRDISATVLSVAPTAAMKIGETDPSSVIVDNIQNDMMNQIAVNDQIYSVDIAMSQDTQKIVPDDIGGISYRYDFDIADISAASNNYYKVGSIIFEPMAVDSISNISLSVKDHIKDAPVGNDIGNSFILYTIITETKYGISEIPILPYDFYEKNPLMITDGKYYATEALMFNQNFSSNNYFTYDLKHDFVSDENNQLYTLNPYSAPVSGSESFIDNGLVGSYSYRQNDKIGLSLEINRYYAYKGRIAINDMHSTSVLSLGASGIKDPNCNWIVLPNRAAYMLYKDDVGKIQVAIKMQGDGLLQNLLYPFTGKVYGKISMISADEAHISPYVFNYSLGCI